MGFLGFIGDVIKVAGGVVGGTITGGPLGGIAGGIGVATGVLGGGGGPVPTYPPPADPFSQGGGFLGGGTPGLPVVTPLVGGGMGGPNIAPGLPTFPQVPTPGFKGTLQRILPGGASGYQSAPPGYHLNKRYLAFVRGTEMGKSLQDPTSAPQVVNPVVKNRQLNPLNPRALRRAIRRQRAAVGIMRRTLAGTGYTITRRGLGAKKARRR